MQYDLISSWFRQQARFKGEEAICFVCCKIIICSQHKVIAVKRQVKQKYKDNCAKVRNA